MEIGEKIGWVCVIHMCYISLDSSPILKKILRFLETDFSDLSYHTLGG